MTDQSSGAFGDSQSKVDKNAEQHGLHAFSSKSLEKPIRSQLL
jgi:hypothetical protein